MMKHVSSFLMIVLIFSFISIYAQNNYDVLPDEGRKELFNDYLMEELNKLSNQRKSDVAAALNSVDDLKAYQKQLRENYIQLLGKFPEKTPLNAEIKGTIECDGYLIEKILFESMPDHHVTANFYIPTSGDGPFPGVIMLCGHIPEAKADNTRYQRVGILFAKNGIATLVVDPVAQGERYQVRHNTRPDRLTFLNGSGTTEATLLDVGSMMLGTSVTAWEVWDNHRAVDYLCSRTDVVDTTKIGCTGSSGGGAQGTFLTAYDSRIKVSAINSFIMNEPGLFNTIGPQTGSQNLSYEGFYGIDHPSYITMFAPKPFLILCATQDFFDINATHETYDEVKQVYEKLGVPEKVDMFEVDDEHGYWQEKRERAITWFRTWFYNDTTSITETEPNLMPVDSLQVTESGQVMYEYETEKNVTDLNIDLFNDYAADRQAFWSDNSLDSCKNKIKELLMLEDYDAPVSEVVETLDRSDHTVQKIKISSGNHVPVTGLLFIPKNISGKVPAVLYVDGRGKETDADENGIIDYVYMDSGKVVLAIDVRGFGETIDDYTKNESKHKNKEHRNAVIAGYIGKTLIGQRVEDIQKALEILLQSDNVDPENITIVGIERAASAVLHAAVLDQRFKQVVIRKDETQSLLEIIEIPYNSDNMTHVVPGMLEYYDYPDLIDAMDPRQVIYAEEPDMTSVDNAKSNRTMQLNLLDNFPNPFNPSTMINYQLSMNSDVKLAVYDIQGREVKTLVNRYQNAGDYSIRFDGSVLTSGIYFYTLESGNFHKTGKMLLLR